MEKLNILTQRKGRYILWETTVPHGKLKRDHITVRDPDGKEISGALLTRQELDRLIREGVVKQDGSPTEQDNLVFRLVTP